MLNRKLSNYLFQGSLVLILAAVILARSIIIGNIDSSIEQKTTSNRILQKEITALEAVVEENKGLQSNHLYELYHRVPSYFSQEELEFEIYSYLYLIGLDYQSIYESNIDIKDYTSTTSFNGLNDVYTIKSISLQFNTTDQESIETIIFELIN